MRIPATGGSGFTLIEIMMVVGILGMVLAMGMPAFVQFMAIPVNLVGVVQVNLIVPASVPPGKQPVVITVNGVRSPPVNIQVVAPAAN